MDIAVLCQPITAVGTENKQIDGDAWHQRTHRFGNKLFRMLWSRREIVGVSCGWTKWRDGWALWSAENTTLFELRRNLSLSAMIPDAEVMRAALDRWGLDAREQTYSMWAGAVWQESRGELCFFRDRIGLTPVFYGQNNNHHTRVFSTSINLLQEQCPESRRVNQARLHAFMLKRNDSGRDDFFENITRLLPGESWHFNCYPEKAETKSLEIQRYWQPGVKKSDVSNQKDAAQFLLEKLRNISADYLLAGYEPINCVSGGLDSTLMLSIQLEQMRKFGIDPERITAVTMGFPSFPSVDETIWTNQLQEYLEHPISTINMEDCWPMKDPAFYIEQSELGPDFHPGSNYESAFVGRVIEKHGLRPLFWGIGADQLFVSTEGPILASLLYRTNNIQLNRISHALKLFGVYRVAKAMVGQSVLGNPLRTIRERFDRHSARDTFSWRKPGNWVKPINEEITGRNQNCYYEAEVPLFTQNWSWELVIRSLRRNVIRWGSFNQMPYLRADFVDSVLALNAELLFKSEHRKGLQQEISREYLPHSIQVRRKGGWFCKIVEAGLGCCEFSSVDKLINESTSSEFTRLINQAHFLKIFAQYRCFCWSNQAHSRVAGEMSLWPTISSALWVEQVC